MTSSGDPKKNIAELFLVISLIVISVLSIGATYYSTFYIKDIEVINQEQYESE